MKKKYYLPILALCVMNTGCNRVKEAPLTPGIQLANLDQTARPGESFYQYACGGWMKSNPLPKEHARFGSFDQLAENNREQLRGLIEELAAAESPAGSVARKIGEFYNIAMDSAKLNNDGAAPIKAELDKLAAIQDRAEIYPILAEMQTRSITPFFALYVSADDMNSSVNILHTYQSGLGMGERDYYLESDDNTKSIREKYRKHIVNMFRLAGYDETASQNAEKAVMEIETRLAKAARSQVELRDPYANYNKKTVDGLKQEFSPFGWDAFFETAGLKGLTELSVGQPGGIKETVGIIRTAPLAQLIAYLQWNIISDAAPYLSDDFVNEQFDFYGKTMSGREELQSRWKRAVRVVDASLGEAVGQMYVEKYFPAEAKERMIALVKNLQLALGERIRNLDWMGGQTKEKALDKLAAFHVKIGYPDKWKDYSDMEITNDSYWANVNRAARFEYDRMIGKVGKPVDRNEWLMTPQTVNAYYNPTTNEICFPAGILQYPFFDMKADDAFNYGAIGVVIGHEMTHGFDDQGRQYDKDGNLKDWWTEEDAKNFEARADVMAKFFDAIEVAPGVHANGQFTLGENIADYGGLQIAYHAFKHATAASPLENKLDFTPEQRFFLAYANVWAGNIRPEEILRRTKDDPHSIGKWRVDGALPHIPAWYEAFGIADHDPMYVPQEKRVDIW